MRQMTFTVTFSDYRKDSVKAYGIDYHRTHIEFKDYYGKTVIAYRSDNVLTIKQESAV